MAKATIHDKLFEQMLVEGYSQLPPRQRHSTPKYQTFAIPVQHDLAPELRLFLGKAGALRLGRTASESIPAENLKARLLAEWDAAHPKRGAK